MAQMEIWGGGKSPVPMGEERILKSHPYSPCGPSVGSHQTKAQHFTTSGSPNQAMIFCGVSRKPLSRRWSPLSYGMRAEGRNRKQKQNPAAGRTPRGFPLVGSSTFLFTTVCERGKQEDLLIGKSAYNTYGAHPQSLRDGGFAGEGGMGLPSPLYFISGRGLPFCCTLNCESFMTLPVDDGQGSGLPSRAYQFKVDVGGQEISVGMEIHLADGLASVDQGPLPSPPNPWPDRSTG